MTARRDTPVIHGKRLTTWATAPDGRHVQLGFEDEAGRSSLISLPVDVLSALMMTIPSMLRQALNAQFADGSLRITHPLGDWRVERALETNASILSLTTPDGFEVAFALAMSQADQLGEMLRHSTEPAAASAPAVN